MEERMMTDGSTASPDTAPGPVEWRRPRIVSSECLGFAAVRYNGQVLREPFVNALREHVEIVPVCPEVAVGLGVPRDPVRLVSIGGDRRLLQPATGLDVTDSMRSWSRDFLTGVGEIDGFILKSRSPSCGIKDVRVYPEGEGKAPIETSAGLFADEVASHFPHLAVEDEGRLTNARIRHNFLTRLFAMAELREVRESDSLGRLVAFHTAYKLVLMAHGQQGLRELGRLVANASQMPFSDAVDRYAILFAHATERPARAPGMVNTLQHAFGYFSNGLSRAEKSFFLELLEELREERVLLNTVLAVLQAWVVRFEEEYLAGQRIFAPYPRELRSLADSGRR
jgi:uncharacterized protein YbgA (DUF1722 family)/uncharacterized protein YbbK (DUF523 family)